MRSYEKFGALLDADLTEIKNQIAWHRLHALRTSGDKRAADKILRQLMELPSPDSDVAIEVVNALKAEDRQDEAKAYFDKAYRLQDTRLSLRLGAAEALNNLAWLCSRSGEQANDAVAMAVPPWRWSRRTTPTSTPPPAPVSPPVIPQKPRSLNNVRLTCAPATCSCSGSWRFFGKPRRVGSRGWKLRPIMYASSATRGVALI